MLCTELFTGSSVYCKKNPRLTCSTRQPGKTYISVNLKSIVNYTVDLLKRNPFKSVCEHLRIFGNRKIVIFIAWEGIKPLLLLLKLCKSLCQFNNLLFLTAVDLICVVTGTIVVMYGMVTSMCTVYKEIVLFPFCFLYSFGQKGTVYTHIKFQIIGYTDRPLRAPFKTYFSKEILSREATPSPKNLSVISCVPVIGETSVDNPV